VLAAADGQEAVSARATPSETMSAPDGGQAPIRAPAGSVASASGGFARVGHGPVPLEKRFAPRERIGWREKAAASHAPDDPDCRSFSARPDISRHHQAGASHKVAANTGQTHVGSAGMKALMHPATLAVFAVVAVGSMLLRWEATPHEKLDVAKYTKLILRGAP
jgi:hypothetical protein